MTEHPDTQTLHREGTTETGAVPPKTGAHPVRASVGTSTVGRAGAPVRTSAPAPVHALPSLPAWAIVASVVWVAVAVGYLFAVGGWSSSPGAIGAIIAGLAAPLVVVWLVAFMQQRALEVDIITGPIRRQLTALLSPGAAADVRIRRITEALAEQTEMLRNAANVALEDSSAAMTAITRQSGELRRLSAEAMLDIGKVGKTAEQTLTHLRETLSHLGTQTGDEREKALKMVAELEKNFTSVLGQLDKVSQHYEGRLGKLNETSLQLEDRTKSLIGLTDGLNAKVDDSAGEVMGDIARLESAVAELSQRSAAIAHLLERPVESLERAAGQLDGQLRQSHSLLQSATNNLEKIGDVVMGRANALVANLSDRLSSMELVGAKLVSLGVAAQNDTGRYVGQIEEVAERIRDYGAESEQRLRSVISELTAATEAGLSRGDAVIDRLQDGTNALKLAVSGHDDRFAALADDIEERTQRLRELGRDARGQLEDVQLSLSSAQDSVESQLERLNHVSDKLSTELQRSASSASTLSEATQLAGERAQALFNLNDKTSDVMNMIAARLVEQREEVEALAGNLTTQIESMQAALVSQRMELQRTGQDASRQSEVVQAALREQVGAIAAAGMDVAARIDVLQQRVRNEVGSLTELGDVLEGKLAALAQTAQQQAGTFTTANAEMSREQKALQALTDRSRQDLTGLLTHLSETRAAAETALGGVNEQLVQLSAQLSAAEDDLHRMAGDVSTEQLRLRDQGQGMNEALAAALQRLETLDKSLHTTGEHVAHQGDKAEAQLARVRTELNSSRELLVAENSEVQSLLTQLYAQMRDGQEQLEQVKVEATEASRLWALAQSQLQQSQSALTQSREQAQQDIRAVDASVHEATRSLTQARAEAELAHETLHQQSERAQARIHELEQDMASLQDVIARLTERSDLLSRSLADQAAQAEIAGGRLQSATRIADQSAAVLVERNKDLQASAHAQEQALVSLRAELDRASGELAQRGELSQERLESVVAAILSASSNLQEQTRQSSAALAQGEHNFIAVRSALATHTASVSDDLSRLGSQVSDLQADLTATGQQAQSVGMQLAHQAEQSEAVRAGIESVAARADKAALLLTERLSEMDMASTSQMAAFVRLTSQLEQLGQQLESSSDSSQSHLQVLLAQLAQTSAALTASSQQNGELVTLAQDRLQESGLVLDRQAQQVQTYLAALETRSQQVEASLRQARSQVGELTSQLEAQQSRSEQLGESTAALTQNSISALSDLEQRYEQMEAAARSQQDEVQRLTLQLEDATASLQADASRSAKAFETLLSGIETIANAADHSFTSVLQQMEKAGSTLQQQGTVSRDELTNLQLQIVHATQELAEQVESAQQSIRKVLGENGARFMQALQAAQEGLSGQLENSRQQVSVFLTEASSQFSSTAMLTEQSLATRLGDLDSIKSKLEAVSLSAAHGVDALTSSSNRASEQMASQHEHVQALAVQSSQLASQLLDAMQQLRSIGGEHTSGLEQLSGQLSEQLEQLRLSGQQARSEQEQLLARTSQAQATVKEMSEQISTARSLVDAAADYTAARLADVSADFANRVREGEGLVTTATTRLREVEQRMAETGSLMEQRQTELLASTRTIMQQLEVLDSGFRTALGNSSAVQSQLSAQAEHNQRLLTGLTQLSEMGTASLEEQTQRLARLAQQAASDTQRMLDMGDRIEGQQASVRQEAQAAVTVLQAVQAQLQRAGQEGSEQLSATEAQLSAALVGMMQRVQELAASNTGLTNQLRTSMGQMGQALVLLQDSGRKLGAELSATGDQLQGKAAGLVVSGQQLDRELKSRLETMQESQRRIDGIYTHLSQRLAELDSRTSHYLIDLDQRSESSFARLNDGVSNLEKLPDRVQEAESLLSAQVDIARREILRLRSDLVELGQTVLAQSDQAGASTAQVLANLQQMSAHSRAMAEQIEVSSQGMATAAQSAWQTIHAAVSESTSGVAGLTDHLKGAENRTQSLVELARSGVDGLLDRVNDMGSLLDSALSKANGAYATLAAGGLQQIETLSQTLADNAARLDHSTAQAHARIQEADVLVQQHQSAVQGVAEAMLPQLTNVRQELEQIREGLSGLDSRLHSLPASLGGQQQQLESFTSAIDRTLNQVAALQMLSRDMAQEHFALAEQLQSHETALTTGLGELEQSLTKLDAQIHSGVVSHMLSAATQAQAVERTLAQLLNQSAGLDQAIASIRQSVLRETQTLEQAKDTVGSVAQKAVSDLQAAGSALAESYGQLQRGTQLSQTGLLQTQEESQRLAVRLEQMRTLLKGLTSAISNDLTEWQTEMRKQLTGVAADLASPAVRAQLPLLSPSPTPVRATLPAAGSSSTQLTTEALQAVAIDLYRLLRNEMPDLLKSLPTPAARRAPMGPGEARAYTQALLEVTGAPFATAAKQLYANNAEFRLYVDRYLTRFEAHYDVLARNPAGLDEAKAYRASDVGRLYSLFSGAIERRGNVSAGQPESSRT